MSRFTCHVAMYGDQYGMMQVGYHKGTPIHIFSHWHATEDSKGNLVVIRVAQWAGGETPSHDYDILDRWDLQAEERFESERHDLMRSVGLNTDEQISLF